MDKKGLGGVAALLFLAIFGIGMGVVPTLDHHISVQEHEPTEATIVSTDIAVKEDDDGDKSYRPDITYRYTVDGQEYERDNVFPGSMTRWRGSRSWAEDVVAQYDEGDQVTVHHSPRDHGQAYLRNDGMPFSWYVGTGYAVVAALAGAKFVQTGFKRRRQRILIRDTPTEQAQSLSIGPSEIKGTAESADGDPMRAPFSEDDCVVAKYEIKEYDEGDDDDAGSWKTKKKDVLYEPFYVDDGTGSVLVRPHDDAVYDLDPDDWTTTYVDSSERGPEPIQDFVEYTDGLGFPSHSGGKDNDRKYKQNLIRHGESVYVFGTAHPQDVTEIGDDNADRLVVQKVDDDGTLSEPMFMISDDTEKSLVNRRKWAEWRLPVGGFFVVLGFACALLIFAPHLGISVPVWI